MRGALIVVCGTDGAGKTTQLGMLENRLSEYAYQTTQVWYRPGYSPRLTALRSLLRRMRPGLVPAPGHSEHRTEVFSRPSVRRLWVVAAALDMALEFGLRIRILQLRGRIVLCDRYLHDGWLDFALNWPEEFVRYYRLISAISRVSARPHVAILLTVSPGAAAKRLAVKNEPFSDTTERQHTRATMYGRLAGGAGTDGAGWDDPEIARHLDDLAGQVPFRLKSLAAERPPHLVHDALWAVVTHSLGLGVCPERTV